MEVGLFGKLPSHGDFLRRRVSDAFVDAWDSWLRECLPASRNVLGERWLDLYLTSPAWRFIAAAGTCGPTPVIGVMVPSVDRVGRYFPLTLVTQLPPEVNPIAAATESAPFFDRAERLIIETLATDDIDFEDFDAEVVMLGEGLDSMLPPRVVLDPAGASVLGDAPLLWQLPIGSAADIGAVFTQLLAQRLSAVYDPLDAVVDGRVVGGRAQLSHRQRPPAPEHIRRVARRRLGQVGMATPGRSCRHRRHGGDAGRKRRAGGLPIGGGQRCGARPENQRGLVTWSGRKSVSGRSPMVWADTATEKWRAAWSAMRWPNWFRNPTFDRTIEAVRHRLQAVNDYLLRTGTHAALADRSASTVVALLVRGNNCAVLWAGDSRVYRWRSGKLERLTRDHSLDDSQGPGGQETSNAITRAVGVQPTLALDLLREKAVAGDRFLLCSDGLTRTVPEAQIEAMMESADISIVVQDLISATLSAGAPDNVTVLVAEAFAAHD